jgi:hypothetical protein
VRGGRRRIPEDGVATKEIQEERIRQLNEKETVEGDYVLYWMQEAQRAEYNHALEYSVLKYSSSLANPSIDYTRRARVSNPWPFSCCVP